MPKNRNIRIGLDLDNGDVKDNLQPWQRYMEVLPKLANEFPNIQFILGVDPIDKKLNNFDIIPSTAHYENQKLNHPKNGTSLNNLISRVNNVDKNQSIDAIVTLADTSKIGIESLKFKRITPTAVPALIAELPSSVGSYILCDAGAIVSKPKTENYQTYLEIVAKTLYHQAIMAATYQSITRYISKPRVGLLCNGTESHKGNDIIKKTIELFELASQTKNLNDLIEFKGRVEPEDAYFGNVDILLTDGFTGNIYLKTSEAAAKLIMHYAKQIKEDLTFTQKLMLAPAVPTAKGILKGLKQKINPSVYAGAVLLGYKGLLVKGHGNSNTEAVEYSIRRAVKYVEENCNADIETNLNFSGFS